MRLNHDPQNTTFFSCGFNLNISSISSSLYPVCDPIVDSENHKFSSEVNLKGMTDTFSTLLRSCFSVFKFGKTF